MKAKNKVGIKWAVLFFIAVIAVMIVLGVVCNTAYKIF
jgi:hypothetical protein